MHKHKRNLFLAVLWSVVVMNEAGSSVIQKPAEQVIAAAWNAERPHVLDVPQSQAHVIWDYRITPPLPGAWPPHSNQKLIYYGYAAGVSIAALADGEYIADPWIVLEAAPGQEPKVLDRRNEIRVLGIQGVRPLRRDEMAQAPTNRHDVASVLAEVTQLPSRDDPRAGLIRDYYCDWLRFNGMIASRIEVAHTPFITWLACNSKK